MRGVILAGGAGTRLGELTRAVNKHLLPVGNEPMICHPLRKLVGAGINEIMVVTGPESIGAVAGYLESGSRFGARITYRVQDMPGGIAQALSLAEAFCKGGSCAVLLGDNVFASPLLLKDSKISTSIGGAFVMLAEAEDLTSYGVAELSNGYIASIEEKPAEPKGKHAVTGIYFYPQDVFKVIRLMRPSARGELEITDVNRHYLNAGRLYYGIMYDYWIDAGTPDKLVLANKMVSSHPPRFQ